MRMNADTIRLFECFRTVALQWIACNVHVCHKTHILTVEMFALRHTITKLIIFRFIFHVWVNFYACARFFLAEKSPFPQDHYIVPFYLDLKQFINHLNYIEHSVKIAGCQVIDEVFRTTSRLCRAGRFCRLSSFPLKT